MTDTTTTRQTVPTEHSIYFGLSRKFTLISSGITVLAMGALGYFLSENPADSLIFIGLIMLAAVCYERGMNIHRRNKSTVTFRTDAKEVVVNDKTYRYGEVELATSSLQPPLMWLTIGKHNLPFMPAWNPTHKKVRTWSPLDLVVLGKFVDAVADNSQKELFHKDWLPLASRSVKIGHTPVEVVERDNDTDSNNDETSEQSEKNS